MDGAPAVNLINPGDPEIHGLQMGKVPQKAPGGWITCARISAPKQQNKDLKSRQGYQAHDPSHRFLNLRSGFFLWFLGNLFSIKEFFSC